MGTDSQTQNWKILDKWWTTHLEAYPLALVGDGIVTIDERRIDGLWGEIDSWWESYGDVQMEVVEELRETLDAADQQWARRAGKGETDPLTTDWKSSGPGGGPLRPNQEENWSEWLASLLLEDFGALSRELFGDEFDGSPRSVLREEHLPDSTAADRYADILLLFDEKGISIEVKKGDEHYGKTVHTASLIERHFDCHWTHILLAPEFKHTSIRKTFDGDFEEGEDARIRVKSEVSNDIELLSWQDVSGALRQVLLSDRDLDPHWRASAYIFCTLIEQKILGLIPKPAIDNAADANTIIRDFASLSVGIGSLDDQVRYLNESTLEENHE